MTMFKRLNPLLIGGLAAFCLSGTPALAKVEILFNVITPPTHVINSGILQPLFDEVKAKTEGRVVFNVAPNSLAPPPRQLDAVNTGIADGAFVFNPFIQKRVPFLGVSLLPLVGNTGEARAVALWRVYQKYYKDSADFGGAHVLGFFGGPSLDTFFSLNDQPITSMASLAGKKLWSTPATAADALGRLGLKVVTGPTVRAYEIVSSGTVDAIGGLSFHEVDTFKLLQFTKSASIVSGGIAGSTFTVMVSKAKWDTIPTADQKIMMDIFGENLARRSVAWDKAMEASKKVFEKEPGRTIQVVGGEFMETLRKAWVPMQDDWVKEVSGLKADGPAALKFYIDQVTALDKR
jgi:TRAP-type C4-dicarboxylate transport system substrate-binding protein